MTMDEILNIEGIVIRKIPMVSVSLWTGDKAWKESQEVIYCNERKRHFIKETKKNSLGGKYLITMANNQDSQVRFDLKNSGVGDTIEEAYINYINSK